MSYADALVRAGVHVRMLASPYVHAKFIVTATQTFVGSQNFSAVSLADNREVGLITANAAIHAQALAWFNAVWTKARPWAPAASSAVRLTWPYLPLGDTMDQVRSLWGPPSSVQHTRFERRSQLVWVYPVGTVDFHDGRVVDVQRTRTFPRRKQQSLRPATVPAIRVR